MTTLSLIVAIDRQGGIGRGNTLPWHLPEDLAFFKRTTTGHPIIMGRKTFDSIGRPLPNRRSIVISRNSGWQHPGAETVSSLEAALALVASEETAFIIGGAQIFAQALPLAQCLLVTEINASFDCDPFFPPIDARQWQEVGRTTQVSDKAQLAYAFVTYKRQPPPPA